mgnify:FL=1
MIFKSVQVDGFVKKPDEKIRAVLVYGSNDGLRRDTVKRLAAAVCPDLNDPFRAAELAGGDLAADIGVLYGEFNGQSLTGGRRVIIVNDAGNDLTKAIRKMLDESPNTGNLLILSGAGSLGTLLAAGKGENLSGEDWSNMVQILRLQMMMNMGKDTGTLI